MDFKKMIFAGSILLSFAACSQNDEMNVGQEPNSDGEGAYMSLSIAMPSAGATRADDVTTEAGTEAEQTISKLLVLVYDANGTNMTGKKFEAKDLRPGQFNQGISTYTVPPFEVSSGDHKVVVIVNPDSHFTTSTALTYMRMAITDMDADKVAAISTAVTTSGTTREVTTPTGFLMTNANFAVNQDENGSAVTITPQNNGDFYADGSVYVKVEGTKLNPTNVTIPVERVVAKIEETTTSYEKTIEGDSQDKVTFEQIALINGNKSFFPIKNIRKSSSTSNGTNDYVVDNNFSSQNADNVSTNFYSYNFAGTADTDYKFETLKTEANDNTVIYTLENTMTKDEQKNHFTTGVYYKATYRKAVADSEDATEAPNLYLYAGVLYTFQELSDAATGLGLSLGSLNDESSTYDDFLAVGVTKYTNGVCYYPYYIRHINNTDENCAVMEFGVVRNNVYKLSINTVKGIGLPKPVNPDETPDETPDAMLQVIVKVLPWTVRDNSIDF